MLAKQKKNPGVQLTVSICSWSNSATVAVITWSTRGYHEFIVVRDKAVFEDCWTSGRVEAIWSNVAEFSTKHSTRIYVSKNNSARIEVLASPIPTERFQGKKDLRRWPMWHHNMRFCPSCHFLHKQLALLKVDQQESHQMVQTPQQVLLLALPRLVSTPEPTTYSGM